MARRITLVFTVKDPDPEMSDAVLEYLESRVGATVLLGQDMVNVVSVEAESWTQVTSQQIFG